MTAATSAAEFERHRDHLTGVAYRMLDGCPHRRRGLDHEIRRTRHTQ